MTRSSLSRRALATAAVAIAAGIGSMAGVSYAQDGKAANPASTTSTAQKTPSPPSPADRGIMPAVDQALQQLVANGTINQDQATAVEQDAAAGSIDPKTLVQSGLVNETQMQAIGNSLDQVKQAAGN
jgi:hypothetical protein